MLPRKKITARCKHEHYFLLYLGTHLALNTLVMVPTECTHATTCLMLRSVGETFGTTGN